MSSIRVENSAATGRTDQATEIADALRIHAGWEGLGE